jgi:hypothetical protein
MKNVKVVALNCNLFVLARHVANNLCPGQPVAVVFDAKAKAEAAAEKLGHCWRAYQQPKSGSFYVELLDNRSFLPADGSGLVRFDVGGQGYAHLYAKSADDAARKLGGRLVQACPGWGRVKLANGSAVELRW